MKKGKTGKKNLPPPIVASAVLHRSSSAVEAWEPEKLLRRVERGQELARWPLKIKNQKSRKKTKKTEKKNFLLTIPSSSSATSAGPANANTKHPRSCTLAARMHSRASALATTSRGPRIEPDVSTQSKIGPLSAVGLTSRRSGSGIRVSNSPQPSRS